MSNQHLIEDFCRRFVHELDMFHYYFKIVMSEVESLQNKIQDEHDKISLNYNYENGDDGIVWADATERIQGNDNFPPFLQKQALIGGFCVIIFHAFERFLEIVFDLCLRDEIDLKSFSHAPDKMRRKSIKRILHDKVTFFQDIVACYSQIKKYKSYEKIDELNQVCNVLKHGTGPAFKKLKLMRPDYFRLSSDNKWLRPLSGDVDLDEKDFEVYLLALKGFLREAFGYKEK